MVEMFGFFWMAPFQIEGGEFWTDSLLDFPEYGMHVIHTHTLTSKMK